MNDLYYLRVAERLDPAWAAWLGSITIVHNDDGTTTLAGLIAGQADLFHLLHKLHDLGITILAIQREGYLTSLTVTESALTTAPPQADFDLALADYTFVVDESAIVGGKQTIRVVNDGPQEAHEIAIVKLMDGATLQDFMAAMAPDAPTGPPPAIPVGGVGPLALGSEAYLDLELEAGSTYGFLCFLPSTHQGGQPHFRLGMMREIVVP